MEEGSSSSTAAQRDHLSIHILHEEDLASSIKSKLENMYESYSICRVSDQLLKGNEERYRPSLVSIGPLHRERMKHGEEHKWRYFNALLMRQPNTEAILNACINALRRDEPKVRNFYCKTIQRGMGSDQLIEMLLIDACFMIELFLENEDESLRRRDDPLFSTNDNISRLMHDLILLENQLPFFVLQHLFHLVPIPKECSKTLIGLALNFLKKLIPGVRPRKFCPEIHHLLDLIRLHYLPTHPSVQRPFSSLIQKHMLQRATQLPSRGIKLATADQDSPLDITFVNGELKIPQLKIHEQIEIVLGNLIAMEHCHPECPKIVTSYAVLMEQLIKFKKDVMFLHDKNILVGGDGREAEIVIMFKRLLVDIDVKEFYYRGVCEAVGGYKASKRRQHWETLRNIYHGTHLGIAGFSLAMFILVFLFTGVLFSVLTFLLHHFQ